MLSLLWRAMQTTPSHYLHITKTRAYLAPLRYAYRTYHAHNWISVAQEDPWFINEEFDIMRKLEVWLLRMSTQTPIHPHHLLVSIDHPSPALIHAVLRILSLHDFTPYTITSSPLLTPKTPTISHTALLQHKCLLTPSSHRVAIGFSVITLILCLAHILVCSACMPLGEQSTTKSKFSLESMLFKSE